MTGKVEIGFGVLSLACFAGALDAALGTGAVDYLIGLGASGSNAPMAQVPDGGLSAHPLYFLSAGLAFAGLGLCWNNMPVLPTRTSARSESRARRRLIAAIVYVARSCKGAVPADVADAFTAATGETLEQGEIAKATGYLKSNRAASLEVILADAGGAEEKRIILSAVSRVWMRHGMDSERATKALERVSSALGLEGDDVPAALDAHWTQNASRILRDVESIARRTVSRATFEVIRITSRGRRMD